MQANKKVNVLVVDDHRIVAHGLQSLLGNLSYVKGIDTVGTAGDALQAARKKKYGVYILDVELPDMPGVVLMEKLRELSPLSAFVFHTMHEEVWTVKAMMIAGADAIVLKSDDLSDLTAAIGEVLAGRSYYSQRFDEYCRRYEQEQMPTQQELEILKAIAAGDSTNDIAKRMCISSNTIEYHRKRLFRKLGAANMADMVARAIRSGLLVI